MLDLYIYGSVLIVSLISFVGAVFLARRDKESGSQFGRKILFLIALAIGALAGDAILHLMPEALLGLGAPEAWTLFSAGVLVFFLLDRVLHWRHSHATEIPGRIEPRGVMNLVADALHNAVDGAAIAGSYLISIPTGIATTVAVVMHEIPQELGDYGILRDAGFSRKAAVGWNFLSALCALFAALIARVWLGDRIENYSLQIIAFTAGGFAYIVYLLFKRLSQGDERTHAISYLAWGLVGVIAMWLLTFLD